MGQWLSTIGLGVIAASAAMAVADPTDSAPPTAPEADTYTFADDDTGIADIELLDLHVPTIVTASRRAQNAASVPYAVSVITAEDIRMSGARSIPDALRLATGVDVADLSYAMAAASPRGYHGFVTRATLVLVDGRQIFDSLFGGTVWGAWPFQIEDIDRIEVIRGPGGVTWGANAVNGVINIITKDPRDQLGLTLTGRGGSRGGNKEHIGYGVAEGNLRLRVSGEYEGSDGWRGGSLLGTGDDAYRDGRFGLHAIYEPHPEDTLTLSAGASAMENGFAPSPLVGFGWRQQPGGQANYIMAKWEHRLSDSEHYDLVAYVNDYYTSAGGIQLDYRYQQFALQFSHTLEPATDHTLNWGIDTRADILDTTNAEPHMTNPSFLGTGIVGLYVQDTWRFHPKWTLDVGARIDYEFYGGFQPSARVALAYELSPSSMLYGAVSRAFQMPPPGIRYLDFPMLNGLAHVTADHDMEATTLTAYEAGYHATLFDNVAMNMCLYWHEYDDLATMSPQLGPPGLVRLNIDSVADLALYGFEFDLKYPVTDRLTLLANYTHQQHDWRADVPYHDTDTLRPPKNKFLIGARYSPTDDLHLSAHLYYTDATEASNVNFPFGARHIDRYFRLDLRAEYEFLNDEASVAVGVRDLLDPSHPEGGTLFLDSIESERMVFAEFRLAIRPSR